MAAPVGGYSGQRARAMTPCLDVQGLSVAYGDGVAALCAVRDVSFSIAPGEAYGLIGESGSGKSTIAYAVMRHLSGASVDGRIVLDGFDVMALSPRKLAAIRGRVAAMVYQDPMSALNPALRVGEQIAEVLRHHAEMTRSAAWQESVALFERVHLPTPAEIARRYPHQLSGGQQQRVVIAMAIACHPELLILDEPTTGLDVTTEAVILDLINELRGSGKLSVLFISHNLGVIAKVCDRVGVLYAGQLLEEGATDAVLRAPRHPYTIGLMNALPIVGGEQRNLSAIPGGLPDLRQVPDGCIFAPRCFAVERACHTGVPALEPTGRAHFSRCLRRATVLDLPPATEETTESPVIATDAHPRLQIIGMDKSFVVRRGVALLRRSVAVHAVADVTLDVPPGGTLAVVGESGSGKSTLARCVAGLIQPESGSIRLQDKVLPPLVERRGRPEQRAIQFIFQNPDAALNPHWTVERIVARPQVLYGLAEGPELRRRTIELLEAAKLGERYLGRYPRELSGGEKQRVCIARAFAAAPRLVVCDEPTSALDISVQAAILNELLALQRRHNTSYLFISHDLGVVRHIAHWVAIMQHGRIVEVGAPSVVFETPSHPYTRALIAAIPRLHPKPIGQAAD
jgi:peptide/nickel transport system ATP-binding protein